MSHVNFWISKLPYHVNAEMYQHMERRIADGLLFSTQKWMWVEKRENNGEIKTIGELGVEAGESVMAVALHLAAVARGQGHKNKHRHTHACRHQTHPRYTAESGNQVEGEQRIERHTHNTMYNPGVNWVLLPLFHHSRLFPRCILLAFLPSAAKANAASARTVSSSRASCHDLKQEKDRKGKRSIKKLF